MLDYKDHFLTMLDDGFIERPRYMDTYMPHSSRVAIGQLKVASHRLWIETGRVDDTPQEERVCQLCREEIECEEHFICRCRAYEDIRDRYETLFRGQPTLREIMDCRDQRQLGRFILQIQSHRDTVLHPSDEVQTEDNRQSSQTSSRGSSLLLHLLTHREE